MEEEPTASAAGHRAAILLAPIKPILVAVQQGQAPQVVPGPTLRLCMPQVLAVVEVAPAGLPAELAVSPEVEAEVAGLPLLPAEQVGLVVPAA